MTMNPKERLLGAVADLQRFVIHHPDQARCPVCPRWDELQGAAMQAVTAIDAHEAELAALRAEKVSQCGHPSSLMLRSAETGKALYCELCDERKRRRDAESMEEHYKAELAALRAELVSIPDELADRFHCLAHAHNHRWHEALCSAVFQLERAEKAEAERESAHAAQRHAEKELAQYMAWYAMAEHQHLHEQRRAEKAEAERDALRAAAMLSYGYLWSVQIEPGTPGLPPLKAVPAARIALRDALDNDERKAGIEQVRAALGKR